AHVDLVQGSLVRDEQRSLQPGSTGLLHIVGGRGGGQPGAEHRLARQVEVAAVFDHGARYDLAETLVLERESGDQAVEGSGQHVLVGGMCVRAVGSRERDAVATEDGGTASGHVLNGSQPSPADGRCTRGYRAGCPRSYPEGEP